MEKDSSITGTELKVDGGASKNDFLMQFQADIIGVPVLRPRIVETTARGSAFLAGLASGFWKDQQDLATAFELDQQFDPCISEDQRNGLYAGWQKAVTRAMDWERH
jgi:glycerol kinase